ncbi:hypothetical protein [Rhodopirellula sp. P2]|uniref:beta-xylosidase family glycoside hydrolase n=1 Tax=Rhodopirellula sp. P2 TaxID=2127060 RepID=UPI0023681337|nr:hypothetical protein [Rhodopirellula sp. P2]WDQ16474.1 hypothetical protein PSR62_23040 [Rhodopirellula sp. P2]
MCRILLCSIGLIAAWLPSATPAAEPITESFVDGMSDQWRWVRENKAGWKSTQDGLQVLIEPGNMWGKDNDAKNVLLHPIPDTWKEAVDVRVQITQAPKKRWEQANLVWYYSDSTMVKLGLELENGTTNIVMGHETNDRARTIAIIPYPAETVQLRFVVNGSQLLGQYRQPGSDWKPVGKTTLPSQTSTPAPHVSLQFYMGEADSNRWATVSNFQMSPLSEQGTPPAHN